MRSIAILILAAVAAAAQPAKKVPPPAKPDINSAWQVDLQKLPGIDRTLAKKIIANRPYTSVDELKRAGVPQATIDKLKPLVRCETGPHEPGRTVVPKKKRRAA